MRRQPPQPQPQQNRPRGKGNLMIGNGNTHYIGKAVVKYVRMSPRKVRYVIKPLRHKTVAEALVLLSIMNRRAVKTINKAIASAFANAKQKDATLTEAQAVIGHLTADGGPMWKRSRAAAFGRAVPIHKRISHITVLLDRTNGRTPRDLPPPAQKAQRMPQQQPVAAASAKKPAVTLKSKLFTRRKAA